MIISYQLYTIIYVKDTHYTVTTAADPFFFCARTVIVIEISVGIIDLNFFEYYNMLLINIKTVSSYSPGLRYECKHQPKCVIHVLFFFNRVIMTNEIYRSVILKNTISGICTHCTISAKGNVCSKHLGRN